MDVMTETLDPKRHLTFDGAKNMRDLGGYSTADGRTTRWRRIVRSAKMTDLTETGQRQLLDYGVGAVIDLRMRREIEKSPNVFAESNDVVFHHCDLWGDRLNDFEPSPSSQGQAEMLADLYRMGLDRCGAVIAGIVCTLADEGDHVSVFHCGAGKDRTGLIAALLLGIVGVPHETIVADFALTDDLFDDPNRNHGAHDPMAIPTEANGGREADVGPLPLYFFSCLPKTMSLALDFLDEEYGGAEGYLRTNGVTDEHLGRLRSKLLD
jgi:protein-tyrosine phosphatase